MRPMAAKGREGTIVWEGETGAILCYPTEFKAQLVSVPHGSLKISKGGYEMLMVL